MSIRTEPLVSVIMPTYNTGKYIAKAIESVLTQTYSNFELVIINDGSTDHTKHIVNSFKDPRIKYYELDKNCGRGYARNYAISKSIGEFIAICDSDDINLPTRLALQVNFLQQNTQIDILGTQLLHFSDLSKPISIYHFPETSNDIDKYFKKGLMGVPHASCMLRKKCFDILKYEDNISYNVEDFELFIRLNRFYKMASLPQALVLYRNELACVTKEKIKKHELYHHYAIYSAHTKLNNSTPESFDSWSKLYSQSFRHKRRSTVTYYKVKLKLGLRSLKKPILKGSL